MRLRTAVCPAIQSVRRSLALPYFEIRLWPRNMPDCTVARSMPTMRAIWSSVTWMAWSIRWCSGFGPFGPAFIRLLRSLVPSIVMYTSMVLSPFAGTDTSGSAWIFTAPLATSLAKR